VWPHHCQQQKPLGVPSARLPRICRGTRVFPVGAGENTSHFSWSSKERYSDDASVSTTSKNEPRSCYDKEL
jgi:hypothetical protein